MLLGKDGNDDVSGKFAAKSRLLLSKISIFYIDVRCLPEDFNNCQNISTFKKVHFATHETIDRILFLVPSVKCSKIF